MLTFLRVKVPPPVGGLWKCLVEEGGEGVYDHDGRVGGETRCHGPAQEGDEVRECGAPVVHEPFVPGILILILAAVPLFFRLFPGRLDEIGRAHV